MTDRDEPAEGEPEVSAAAEATGDGESAGEGDEAQTSSESGPAAGPGVEAVEVERAADVEVDPTDEVAPADDVEVDPAPEAEALPEVEPVVEADAEPAEVPEPVVVPEPEPVVESEPVVEADALPDGATGPEPIVEPQPQPEPEQTVVLEPVVAPEPEPQPEPEQTVVLEPVVAPVPEPEPEVEQTVALEPLVAPLVEPEPEPEQTVVLDPVAAPAPQPFEDVVSPSEAVLLGPARGAAAHPAARRRRRWPRVLGATAAVLVVLAGGYVAAQWLTAERVASGTQVAGVQIGGLDADAAVQRLEQDLASATTDPIPVTAGEQRTTLDPAAAGLTFDARATVDRLTGFDLAPAHLWRQVFGGGEATAVTHTDAAALGAALTAAASSLDVAAVDGTVAFVDGQVTTTEPVPGTKVDLAAAQDLLAASWLTAARPVELPTAAVDPVIGQAEVEAAVADLARPLSKGPVVVAVGGQRAELPASVLVAAATFATDGDHLALRLDGPALVTAVLERTTGLLTPAADATFVFADGAPQVQPGTPGTTIDPDKLATAVAGAISGDRTANVELVPTDPAQSTSDLETFGIRQVVSEFTTPLTSERIRTINIANGASKLNGMLIKPGETFSLGAALGPIDAAHGYVQAGAIVNGEHTDAWGGGLSQISTTTYNAAYLAGMELVEHRAHSEWFRRYPEGRESTLFTPTIDLKWKNNTPYGALLQAFVDKDTNAVTVRIWGTSYWTVESQTSPRWNVVAPTTVYSQSPTCEPQKAGNPGFSVKVTRRVSLEGVLKSEESWTTTYKPQNTIVCGAKPEP